MIEKVIAVDNLLNKNDKYCQKFTIATKSMEPNSEQVKTLSEQTYVLRHYKVASP